MSRQRADALAQRVLEELRVCEEALAAAQRHAGGMQNIVAQQEVRERKREHRRRS